MKELFERFNATDVDISFGNRQNKRLAVMGAAALFRAGKGSHFFWKTAYQFMRRFKTEDDQRCMKTTLAVSHGGFKFRWLSFNWAFASHGVLPSGVFRGSGRCYRVSLPVNGPVRFIHGSPEQCKLINGANGEHAFKQRCYFAPSECSTTMRNFTIAFGETQLREFTSPLPSPNLYWDMFGGFSPTSLFWPDRTM